MKILSLETKNLRLDFNGDNGSLVNVHSKESNWDVIKRPELALSWRMMLPLDGRRNNEAWGHEQEVAPKCELSENSISFTWDKITSKFGGEHNIAVKTICSIENDQAVFNMNIKNNASCTVENVYYPYIGDLYRPTDCERFTFQHGSYIGLKEYEMYPLFPNQHGTHSVDFQQFVRRTISALL